MNTLYFSNFKNFYTYTLAILLLTINDYKILKNYHNMILNMSEFIFSNRMLTTKKEHAQKDLQGLEETVARELATLNKLRQMFVRDLQSRMKVVSSSRVNFHL